MQPSAYVFCTLSLYPVNPLYRPPKSVKNSLSFSCIHHQTKEPFWLQLPPFDSSDKKRKAKTSHTRSASSWNNHQTKEILANICGKRARHSATKEAATPYIHWWAVPKKSSNELGYPHSGVKRPSDAICEGQPDVHADSPAKCDVCKMRDLILNRVLLTFVPDPELIKLIPVMSYEAYLDQKLQWLQWGVTFSQVSCLADRLLTGLGQPQINSGAALGDEP